MGISSDDNENALIGGAVLWQIGSKDTKYMIGPFEYDGLVHQSSSFPLKHVKY